MNCFTVETEESVLVDSLARRGLQRHRGPYRNSSWGGQAGEWVSLAWLELIQGLSYSSKQV